MDLAQLSAAYLEQFQAHNRPATVESRTFWVTAFLDFCRDYQIEGVQAWHLAGFRQRLETRPGPKGRLYAPHSVWLGMRAVQAFLRWALERGHLAEDPIGGQAIMSKPPDPVKLCLSPPELLALLQAAPPIGPLGLRDRALLETLVGAALPLTQANQLKLDHLDFDQAVLHWPDGRSAPLGRRLLDLLSRYLDQARPCLVYHAQERRLFPGEKGGNWSTASIAKLIQHCADQAGLCRPVTARMLARSGAVLGQDFHDLPFSS